MCLKSKWNNIGVKKKVFISSVGAIVVGFIILYLNLYIFMPQVYKIYKFNALEKKVNQFVSELEKDSYNDIDQVLDKFTYENNVMIGIKDYSGKIIYSSFRQGFIKPNNIMKMDEKRDNINPFNIDKSFFFKQFDKQCIISVHSATRVVDEMKSTIKVFFPFAVLTIIVIAITVSLIYSNIISKPLIEISKKAKKMSSLDFSQKLYPKGNDEISDLSISLNTLSENLNRTIKELESANIKLKEDIEKERRLERERREFIATISHELKSPLTIISGQIEGMIHNIGKYKDRDKYLSESYEVTRKMESLVFELLDISRRDKDDFKLEISNINLSKMVREILRDNYFFVEDKKINLQEIIEENIYVEGDRRLIKKALTNVIKNSIQHSPEGEKVIVVLVKDRLVVKNTGVFINREEIDNIFKAFYRVDKSRNSSTGGTGLGLYIVKTIIDKHENMSYTMESDKKYVMFKLYYD
ncbi:sensor histidine kinase [Clostridium paraputrificum]|uniref:sensor histidine kinase n=2 Tax=Clostridium paraputrificum TaxID=29363 RepID=UPI00189B6BF5|nr:HAMP domain-containing sensor histidine kinase [Clostridium paraputrificum]MDB2125461.1 HAMP domain-containing sensor histidine kinase [Clostridium paraputrificum]